MTYKNKLLILSGTLFVLCAASACSTQKMNAMFASERTVPEGSEVTFEQRHPPALNPGGNPTDSSNGAPAKRIPSENNSNLNAPVSAPVSPTSMNETVTPVQMANTAPMVTPLPATPAAPVAPAQQTANNSAYPVLASVPAVPPHPTQAQTKSDFNALVADRDTTNSESKNLMNDTSATVMTSPQTGQLVANAETATPQPIAPAQPVVTTVAPSEPAATAPVVAKESSDTGFNGWLHSVFGSPDKKSSEMASNNTVRKTPVENIEAENAPITFSAQQPIQQPVIQPVAASSEPLPFATPTSASSATVTASAPVAQNPAPAALPSTVQLSEPPVVLREPISASNEPLPDTSALQDRPINLVPPSGAGTYSNTRYIADSRYAATRANAN